jgi:hypothetical protein
MLKVLLFVTICANSLVNPVPIGLFKGKQPVYEQEAIVSIHIYIILLTILYSCGIINTHIYINGMLQHTFLLLRPSHRVSSRKKRFTIFATRLTVFDFSCKTAW